MHATKTKAPKHQDQIDLERAAGEGMTASGGEHAAGTSDNERDDTERRIEPVEIIERVVARFKQRPLEVIGGALCCGFVLGACIATIARRG